MSNAQLAIARDQLDLLAYHASRPDRCFGETYDPARDGLRLGQQGLMIFRLMCDGKPWTLPMFAEAGVPGLSSSHSARVREIRDWMEDRQFGTIINPPPGRGGLWKATMVRCPPPYPARSQKGRFSAKADALTSNQWPVRGIHYDIANK